MTHYVTVFHILYKGLATNAGPRESGLIMHNPPTHRDTKDFVTISPYDLPSLDDIARKVQDDGAGAITTFSGTTRNVFEGILTRNRLVYKVFNLYFHVDKVVIELNYEAYIPMAVKVLHEIIKEARTKWSLKHVAIHHRTGVVPVGEVSVIVATSSKHRGDSMDSARYLIDELKDRCPIWKKEVYEDGSVWKGACKKESCSSVKHESLEF